MERVRTGVTSRFVIIFFLTALFLLPAGCGRRGDPVLPPSYEEQAAPEREEGTASPATGDIPVDREEEKVPEPLKAPEGLTALYTGKSVVLTWNEIPDRRVAFYRVYRSSGDGYEAVAETATNAYTDRNVKEAAVYNYRVSAVGESEGPLSEALTIQTETK